LDKLQGATVVRAPIQLLTAGGRVIEHVYWLNKQASVNGFLAEMAALGFPAQTWGTGPGKTPPCQASPGCVSRLEGVRFRATKSHRDIPAKAAWAGQAAREAATYHDLHIGGRVQGAPMPAIGAVPTPAQPAQPSPQPQPAMGGPG